MLGYSEGRLRANDATFPSGGQCEDGLKMIIAIGEVEVPTLDGNKNHDLIESVIISKLNCKLWKTCCNHNILISMHTHTLEVLITDISTSNRLTTDGSFLFVHWLFTTIILLCHSTLYIHAQIQKRSWSLTFRHQMDSLLIIVYLSTSLLQYLQVL